MTLTPQLGNLINELPSAIFDTSDLYTYRMQENIMYLLCIVVHCASVYSCSRPSIFRMGGGMHLLIDR